MQDDDLASGGTKPQLGPVSRERRQPDIVAVETKRTIGVGDCQVDGSHAGLGGYRGCLHVTFLPRLLIAYSPRVPADAGLAEARVPANAGNRELRPRLLPL